MIRNLVAAAAALALAASTATAQVSTLNEGFDNVPALLTTGGWFSQNNSSPLNAAVTGWSQGNAANFVAQGGATNSFAGVNFNSGTGTATLSNWLVTPEIDFSSSRTFSFYTRSASGNFPDRMQVRLSAAGASTNVGTAATDIGDFATLLFDINPTYTAAGFPTVFTEFTATIPAQANGRIAFRYFVENGGPGGTNSNYMGVDTVSVAPVPEPGLVLLACAAAGVAGYVRRRRVF